MRVVILALLLVSLFSSCASKRPTVLRNPSASQPDVESNSKQSPHSKVNKGAVSVSGLDYVDRYKGIAIREMDQYGIPASIKLAQALLESGNGNSYLAREANNHFGIKCGGVWSGKSVTKDDDNPNDCFRVYKNVDESYRDHSLFLLRKRYEKLFALDKDDYKGWAKGLKDAGYATNPRYPALLIDLIERYQLYQYDKGDSVVSKGKREAKVERIIEERVLQEPNTVQAEQIKAPLAMVIHEVKASQTLYGIAKQYNTSVDQIKSLNNLATDNVSIGQLLVVSK